MIRAISSRVLCVCLALPVATATLGISACAGGPSTVDDELGAELAYLGLDRAIDRAIKLGFDGYNAASNANIPEQREAGDVGGEMTVGGKVDQGASNNKEMDLEVTLVNYNDGPVQTEYEIIYNGGPAILDLSLKGLPDANLTGSLTGTFAMDGDLVGNVALDLAITGMTQDRGDGTIERAPGTIRVVGTATSDYGVFNVDVAL